MECENLQAIITVDMKKYRIRIFKSTIHQMGDPKYVLLLINPSSQEVAVLGTDSPTGKNYEHRISHNLFNGANSIDLYSSTLMKRLTELNNNIDTGCSYNLYGTVNPRTRAAVFSLNTMSKIE